MWKYSVLLLSSVSLGMVHEQKLSHFFKSVAENDIQQVRYMIQEDTLYPKQKDSHGAIALCYACSIAMGNLLLENGADPFAISNDGSTTLMWAVSGHTQAEDALITLLLQKGVDINAQGPQKKTALIIAAKWNNIRAAKVLIDAGADIFIKDVKKRSARKRLQRLKPTTDDERTMRKEILQIMSERDLRIKKSCVVQ